MGVVVVRVILMGVLRCGGVWRSRDRGRARCKGITYGCRRNSAYALVVKRALLDSVIEGKTIEIGGDQESFQFPTEAFLEPVFLAVEIEARVAGIGVEI